MILFYRLLRNLYLNMKQQQDSDIMYIKTNEDMILESIKSNHFDKIFSFKEPYNIDTIEYLEYLYENHHLNDILKLYDYLPRELFEDVDEITDYFYVDEWKDYSSGSRMNRTERSYKNSSNSKRYIDINYDNFENFIKICKNILESNLHTTYEDFIENKNKNKVIYTHRKEVNDSYYEIKNKTIRYYKFL